MSKGKEKSKSKKRRKSDNINATMPKQNQQRPKTMCIIDDNGIGVSRQLAKKMKTNRSFGRPRKHVNNNNNEPRICGNGKPMPSLADLEKMFDDSDDDTEESKVNNTTSLILNPYNCSTPKKTPIISEDKLKSPSTIKTIADKMLDFISNLPDATILLDDVPPPPVVPPKKRKKPDVPYIVGCKDRPKKISSIPNTNFCKGDDDYGVDPNDVNSDEDDYPKPRAKRSKIANVSKSIFNARSDEIAAHLKEYDAALSDGSSDSNKTVAYEYYTSNSSSIPRSFSPLPSTSKDNETMHKNDVRFSESLNGEQSISGDTENELEIINKPLETIVVDNEIEPTKTWPLSDNPLIVIDDNSPPHRLSNKLSENITYSVDDSSCIEIIENKTSKIDDSLILVDDYYSSLDFSVPNNDGITEIIDVDDVIAESNAIIEKYRKTSDLNTVTLVQPQANKKDTPSEHIEKGTSTVVDNVEPAIVEHQDTIIDNTRQNSIAANYSTNNPLPAESVYTQNSSDVEFVSSTPRQETSAVEYVGTMPRLNNPPVVPQPLPPNGKDIENVVRNFFNPNSNQSQTNTCQSSCNSHSHQSNSMCILSFLQSMSDIAKNLNTSSSNKESERNFPPQAQVTPPPATTSETRNERPQVSKGLGDCPICMDSLAMNQVASTICGHIFCMKCISAAVKSSGKRCPTCRKVLKGVGFHPLFL